MDCIFCKIVQKKIAATVLYEDTELLCFQDIHPKAPIHYLLIPKKHIATINDATQQDALLLGNLTLRAKELARNAHIEEKGYRLIYNVNTDGGQEVYHIHLHLLGGRSMHWPPG